MRIDGNGNIHLCEKELFALIAKLVDPLSRKGMQGALDERVKPTTDPASHSHMVLFVESDEDHERITKEACGVSYVPSEIYPDHVSLAEEVKKLVEVYR